MANKNVESRPQIPPAPPMPSRIEKGYVVGKGSGSQGSPPKSGTGQTGPKTNTPSR